MVTCVGRDADHQPEVDEVERILQEERTNRSVSTIHTAELRRETAISAEEGFYPR